VLPLRHLSGLEDDVHYTSGIHEQILTELSKIGALGVISSSSVQEFQEGGGHLPTIGQTLNARYVGEGSVLRAGDSVRINFQLNDAQEDRHVWSETFDSELSASSVLGVTRRIALEIAFGVHAALTPEEEQELGRVMTTNTEALDYYWRGREYWSRPRTESNLRAGMRVLEQAIALDSSFASAYAWLSRIHGMAYGQNVDRTPERRTLQRAAAERALALDPDLPEGHVAMGYWHFQGSQPEDALRHFLAAAEKTPNDARTIQWLGWCYRAQGDWERALAAFRSATRFDPRDAAGHQQLGMTYRILHRYPEAARAFDRSLALAPEYVASAHARGMVFLDWHGTLDTLRAAVTRFPDEALDSRIRVARLSRDTASWLSLLETAVAQAGTQPRDHALRLRHSAETHQLRGDRVAAQAALDSAVLVPVPLLEDLPGDLTLHQWLGEVYARMGRTEDAARAVEQYLLKAEGALTPTTAKERAALILAQAGIVDDALRYLEPLLAGPSYTSVHQLQLDPRYDPIRDDPRFQALLEKYASDAER
jgi:serine/threonine-protein kinase